MHHIRRMKQNLEASVTSIHSPVFS